MSRVWDMIFQLGSTIKLSIGLTVTITHRRDMTERLLKVTLNTNQPIMGRVQPMVLQPSRSLLEMAFYSFVQIF